MPQFYAEILRSPGTHDNSFRLLNSNDPSPSTIAWAKDIGVTATSDGDILAFSGSSPGLGVTWFPGSTSSTTYPYLIVRAKAASGGTLAVAVFNSGATMNLSFALTSTWQTFSLPLTTGRTISSLLFGNQSVAGNILLHYAYLCGNTPVQLSQKDVISGSVTRSSLGTDHAELRLNNYRGKFFSSANSFSFGDHLQIYLGQGSEPFHVYGGETEHQEPMQPNDEMIITSRGFGIALQQAVVENQPSAAPIYTNSTPLAIINDFIDNHVNNATKNGVPIATNYRISRCYMQSIGNTIPLYISQFKNVWESMRELMDLSVAQGFPGVFFVDPAENLHVVPLGPQAAANSGSAHYGGGMFYPAAKNLGLNITALGSVYSPPLFDFYFRITQGANCKTTALGSPPTIFFATDASNRFEYNFVSDGNTAALQSILGVQGINNVTDNYWYHVLLPIGPNGGVLFNSTPVANTVAPTIYTGASQYQRTNVGTPSWSNINYVGVYWEDSGVCVNPSGCVAMWHDGWRIIGGRHILAYDNRASPPRYPNMREIHFFDPITKDDTALNNYAIAELKRLRNGILRGTATTPLLADVYPEQQIQVSTTSANYSNTFLRATSIVHRFSPQGMLTEFQLSDDFTNSQPLDLWKLTNVLSQMGENAILSRELYDLKTAILDPTFTPQLIPVI